MYTAQQWFNRYGESHQNLTNKLIHWVCIPLIVFSLVGLLVAIPLPLTKTMFVNLGALLLLGVLIFYFRLSFSLFLGGLLFCMLLLWGNFSLWQIWGNQKLAIFSGIIFFLAWVGQFIGHKIEGAKPSFMEDLKFFLIGPAWLIQFIYKKLGIKI
ncbi:MAG: DUF962 domain-containing protein [Chitinophagales bacterium]|nr:DUF962 domain-containing protein [Chitinophagales bacterium]